MKSMNYILAILGLYILPNFIVIGFNPLSRPPITTPTTYITTHEHATAAIHKKNYQSSRINNNKVHQQTNININNNNNIARLFTRSLPSSSSLSLSSTSDSNPNEDTDATPTSTSKPAITSILNAALLISGTTIGGGFLALPTVTSTIGFIPSSITLLGVWFYFLFQSFVLVECIQSTRQDELLKMKEQQEEQGIELSTSSSSSSASALSSNAIPTVSSIAKNIFGKKGEILIGLLLTILIEATLVSQISRAGLMFNPSYYKVGCALSSISIATFVFGPKSRGIQFASKMNSFLTIAFLCSTVGVFSFGIPNANWDQLGLLGSASSTISSSSSSISLLDTIKAATAGGSSSSLSLAIPTFLQLLVYGEIVPTVCEILNYNTKAIRTAILVGSFLTLCLQIGWSGLGIALVPPVSAVAGAGAGAGVIANDAVNILLQQGGMVKIPLLCLAITAILTTILGSYLALFTMFNDIYTKLVTLRSNDSSTKEQGTMDESTTTTTTPTSMSFQQRLIVGSTITLPALCIASTSPSIFLKAIDFAGSYPVLLLWGVLPPAMALVQRHRHKNKNGTTPIANNNDNDGRTSSTNVNANSNNQNNSSSGPSSWLIFLISISMGMVGMSAKQDILSYVTKLIGS